MHTHTLWAARVAAGTVLPDKRLPARLASILETFAERPSDAIPQAAGSWGLASPAGSAGAWWPAELGLPAASGIQNAMRYAYFPVQRRLAIAVHEHVWIYDTLDHQVSGVSQQQGSGSTMTFTSQHGVVEVTSLPLMASQRSRGEPG
jgi:hypothetical protein